MGESRSDWRSYLNSLSYCFGCGRFRKSAKGSDVPKGWKVLYQPHPDAPPGLVVCSEDCSRKVQRAVQEGPVHEPLVMGKPPMMDAEVMRSMMEEVGAQLRNELESLPQLDRGSRLPLSQPIARCTCEQRIRFWTDGDVTCPACGQAYNVKYTENGVLVHPIPEESK